MRLVFFKKSTIKIFSTQRKKENEKKKKQESRNAVNRWKSPIAHLTDCIKSIWDLWAFDVEKISAMLTHIYRFGVVVDFRW